MENDPQQKTWEEIQDHGVLPHIKTWEDYIEKYQEGLANAHAFLAQEPKLWPQKTITETHKHLFQNIAPWAGTYSSRQEVIASIPGSPPELRNEEFELLEKQIDTLQTGADSNLARIRIAAFHHSRILCMHPFKDGNGRVTRLLLEHQIASITGKIKPLICTKATYIEALQAAHPQGNLASLSNLLCQTYLGKPDPAKFLPVPFRMNSLQIPDDSATRLRDSIREGPDTINATETPKAIRWLTRISWAEVKQLVAAKETKALPKVQAEWESNLTKAMTLEELHQFLQGLENQEPYVQRIGFRNKATSWKPVEEKLVSLYKEAIKIQTKPVEKAGPEM